MSELIQRETTTVAPTLPKEFGDEYLQEKFKQVEDEVKSEVLEVETVEGRKRVKALAAKINKSKSVLDSPMRDHLRELKALPKVLEASARESKVRFEQLRESVIAPLNEAQKYQDDLLEWLNGQPVYLNDQFRTSSEAKSVLEEVNKIDQSTIWPELKKKFDTAIELSTTTANLVIERLEREEAQAAELKRLQEEAAKREQEEHDRKVAEAAEQRAKQEAEQKAQAEKEAIERRAVEAKQREETAKLQMEQAKQDVINAEERRVQEAADAEERAKQAAIDFVNRANLQAEEAAKAERERIEEEEAEHKRLAEEREADKEHRVKINRAALVTFVAAGISEEDAKTVITMIAKKEVPNISIQY